MKNLEKKSLANFAKASLNLNEMKKVQGGGNPCARFYAIGMECRPDYY